MQEFENFDKFTPILEKCKKFKDLVWLSLHGNLEARSQHKKFWDAGDNTGAEVMLWNERTKMISTKYVKYSKKGYFINTKHGRVYLSEFEYK